MAGIISLSGLFEFITENVCDSLELEASSNLQQDSPLFPKRKSRLSRYITGWAPFSTRLQSSNSIKAADPLRIFSSESGLS